MEPVLSGGSFRGTESEDEVLEAACSQIAQSMWRLVVEEFSASTQSLLVEDFEMVCASFSLCVKRSSGLWSVDLTPLPHFRRPASQ